MEKIRLFEKEVKVQYVDVDGVEFPAEELLEILEALDGTDGVFTGVCISNLELRKKLEELNVISTNIRGTSSIEKNASELKIYLINELYKEKLKVD